MEVSHESILAFCFAFCVHELFVREKPSDAYVQLKVFDVLGREVVTLVDGDVSAGYQQIPFDAGKLASGVYFYRMDARSLDRAKPGMFTSVKKMLVVK